MNILTIRRLETMAKEIQKNRPKKKSSAHDKILSKARTLFGKKGYQHTTLRAIAEACGCEPANIYNFFSSKENILFEILDQEMDGILANINKITKDEKVDPVYHLKAIFDSHGRVTLGKMRTSRTLFDSSLRSLSKQHQRIIIEKRDEYDRILRLVIQRGIDSGVFDPTDVKMASFAIASIIARARVWYRPGGVKSVEEIINTLFLFALKALGYKGELVL